MNVLTSDETMSKILSEIKFIKCKRQLPNLKRLLTKSEFNELRTSAKDTRCNEPRCGLCKHLLQKLKLFSKPGGQKTKAVLLGTSKRPFECL